MSWYRTGSIGIANGAAAVTGAGTAWAANVQAGDQFRGPDYSTYEVQSVNADTSITLAENYRGSTVASGGAYAIAPTQGRVRDLAAAVLQLITDLGDVDSALTVAGGRVGLGKSPNAAARLDVSGQVWVDATSGDATLRMLVSAVEKGKLGVTSAGRAYVESNGAEVMTWLNGNVGIGTEAPAVKLEVSSAAAGAVEVLRATNSAGGAGVMAALGFHAGGALYAGISGGYGATAPEMDFKLNSSTPGNFVWTDNGVERLRINSDGYLVQTLPTGAPTLTADNTMAARLESATSLRFYARSGGVTRSGAITIS